MGSQRVTLRHLVGDGLGGFTVNSARFVNADQLHQLVTAGLIRWDDALGSQVLQHPIVRVIRRPDFGNRGQNGLQPRHGHRFLANRAPNGNEPEPYLALFALANGEVDEQLVAHELIVRLGSGRGRIFDADEADAVHHLEAFEQHLRKLPFAGPVRRVSL